ncbi:hypothetical protein CROQUDRAFT_51455 [Cronartium quercuum f. sp. fusiforme G11]|uniref:Glycoside hydrolase family 71 protein n=1 Tax=Cronartium quercuum f. sp. fusiforme G11 TaxID=708437 RepID=A0A9P6NDC8_9BASI|nr:hypothetical protein CROQUDRAFT_51455 [Cronartium quercuum f. sp. fusiforme G11]
MVGNTYSYRLVDWVTDLLQIQEAGFDAVALNLGPDCWQAASVALAYKASSQLGNGVKLFLSLDMSGWPHGSDADASKLATLVNKYVNHPAQFKYDGKVFISTFSGDQYPGAFGRATVCEGYTYFRSLISTANTTGTYFMPAFFPSNISKVVDCVDGLFQWNSAWSLTQEAVNDAKDKDWIKQLGPNKAYMANVSPTFFTNYGASSLNKSFVYNAGNNYAKRWAQAIELGSNFVQVSTWNDYGESHYIGPRPHSTQLEPATTSWVNAANHLPWARITKQYIQMYKTGKVTNEESDLIIWEYRQHPKAAVATKDAVGRPANADWLSDEVYVTAFLSQPAEVRVHMGRNQTTVHSFSGKAGLNNFVAPYPTVNPDGPVVIGMYRNNTNVGGLQQSEVQITSRPSTYNFNPIVDQFYHDPGWEACNPTGGL